MIPVGALAGLGLACGILLIASAVLAGRPSLMARVEPYVRAADTPSRPTQLADGDASFSARLLRPLAQDSARVLDHLGSSTASVRHRLRTLGSPQAPEAFRVEQLLWAAGGLAIGLIAALVIGATRGGSPLALAAVAVVCAVAGALARDRALSRAVKQREVRIAAEFPTVAELLALAIGSGEAPSSALARVARSTHGDLAASSVSPWPMCARGRRCRRRWTGWHGAATCPRSPGSPTAWPPPSSAAAPWRRCCAPRPGMPATPPSGS